MVSDLLIRDMREQDLPQVLVVEEASFPSPWTVSMFRNQLRIGDIGINLVLEEGGSIVGYAAAWVACDDVHLFSIAVLPRSRGRGHGGRLLDAVIGLGKVKGGRTVILEVRESNTAARRFYGRRGFEQVSRCRKYYSDTGEDALIMELRLHE